MTDIQATLPHYVRATLIPWGGLIEVMYTTFQESEIDENIKKLKQRLDLLEGSKTLEEIKETFFFTKKERDYLNSPLLDEIFASIFSHTPLEDSIRGKMLHATEFYLQRNFKVEELWFKHACSDGSIGIMELLLKYKVPIPDSTLIYALDYKDGNRDLIELILKHRKPPSAQDLACVCARGSVKTVELFLKYGADVKANNNDALKTACSFNYKNVAELLLKHGATFEDANDTLQYILGLKKMEMLEFMLENGVNPNNVVICGRRLIVVISKMGELEMVKLLLKYGADCRVDDNAAIRAAYNHGYQEIVDLLARHGAVLYFRGN